MSIIKGLFGRGKPKLEKDIHILVAQLLKDRAQHSEVGNTLSDIELQEFTSKSGFDVPPSFSVFLREFGDGAYWLYDTQPVDSTTNSIWLKDSRPKLPSFIPLDEETQIPATSLFCLMTEDSNGGAWCWLTGQRDENKETPLVYYDPDSGNLCYKVQTFVDWLYILVSEKEEVIRVLDSDTGLLVLG